MKSLNDLFRRRRPSICARCVYLNVRVGDAQTPEFWRCKANPVVHKWSYYITGMAEFAKDYHYCERKNRSGRCIDFAERKVVE